jgi:predicted XRE-type DNA-binding protein
MRSEVKKKGIAKTRVSIAEVKRYLQKNDLTEIAQEVGITRSQVSNVLAGRSKNFKVLAKLVERAEGNKALTQRAGSI